ncbi:MDR efflux pump AcrAB transcriptional activator RobA [Candidatus Sodalis sp. SoCistrobi]|uniref:MDR efflux pump AcrAB transcriptional activator RobA n=1 Tax=Candidatus Sodalis sp. SoCistrobi TaxID=1922216 RepID=UPI00093F7780|nr:MDR efflux pump AcrAB transcriptional activator RobA [Candidatus Sodalis sp. SoCistrobi]
MDQAGIIRDLLSWLDSHLDQPLSLDNVAAKAGYSKWHLQRMFKEVTGQAIGAYIRARRLSKAAVALRLTSRPILDIALQYRFDSQQTFTRAFKKQFAQTPALYRRKEEWDSTGIRPPIRLEQTTMPQAEFIRLPAMELIGVTQSYTCTLEQLSSFRTELRIHFWRQYLGEAKCLPPTLYGLNHTRPSLEKDDEQEVLYTTAIEPQHMPENVHGGEPVLLEGGEYARFIYQGPPHDLQDFILALYGTCLPSQSLVRRKGCDIERFFPPERKPDAELPHTIRCEYLIPVRR